MQFMMLMIPNVYRGNQKLDGGFAARSGKARGDGPVQ